MPLMKVKYQNWNADFAYAPPTESAVINTDEILRVTPKESRGEGPWVLVEFSDGSLVPSIRLGYRVGIERTPPKVSEN